MNTLIEKNIISEMACGSNFAYVLNDNNIFLSTEYKVLQNQGNGCFVKCMRMLYNGNIQLFYQTKSLKSLSYLVSSLNPDKFMTIVSNLFSDIIDVKQNGFLSCQNIDIGFDKIFVDPATFSVSLVYLPVNETIHNDYSSFENDIKISLIRLISKTPSLRSAKTKQLCDDLSNGTLTLEAMFMKLKGGNGFEDIKKSVKNNDSANTSMRLIAMNAPSRIEIHITQDEFVIGKKAGVAQGVVDFNKMISRRHCKIIRNEMQYSVVDLGSVNGTFVNKRRLAPNTSHVIHNGDIIRMANSDFQVVID